MRFANIYRIMGMLDMMINDTDVKYEDDIDPDLDISSLQDNVWLVKVPRFLYDRWVTEEEEEMQLANVRIEANNFDNLRLVLEDEDEDDELPTEYHINMVNKQPASTFVFSEQVNEEGAIKTAIVGTVAHECSLTPVLNERYKFYASNKAAAIPRQIQRLDGMMHHGTNSSLAQANARFTGFTAVTRRGKNMPDKGVRMDKSELLDILFLKFEDYEYWTLKGLREVTKQPEAYLKEVLGQVGVLIKKGPYAQKWTLKPEYKGVAR